MFCGLRSCVILFVVCLLATCSADFSCICNYKVELPVYEQGDTTSTVIGYMYEFDCKPQVQNVEVSNEWFIIMFERKMGYVEKDSSVSAQVCPGGIPDTDMLPATEAPPTVTSAMTPHSRGSTTSSTTSAVTFTRVPNSTTISTLGPVSTHAKVTTTTSKATTVTSVSTTISALTLLSTTSVSSSSSLEPASETTAFQFMSALTETISVLTTNTSSLYPPLILKTTAPATAAIKVTSQSGTTSGEHRLLDQNKFQEKKELCPTWNSTHLMTHTSITGYCYEFVTNSKRMQSLAELHCNIRHGHLLSIYSDLEDEYIYQMIARYHLKNETFWTGLSIANNTVSWNDGSSTGYLQYIHLGDSGFNTQEECVAFKSTSNGSIWERLNCSSSVSFICKYATIQVTTPQSLPTFTSAQTTTQTTTATTTDPFEQGYMNLCSGQVKAQELNGNIIAQNDTSCYVLYQNPDEWSQARDLCASTSGHMLTIKSLMEQVFIETFLRHYGIRNGVWLGLNDRNMEGNFTWITGESITFSNWNSRHDDDVLSDFHDCVLFLPAQAGVWHAAMCSQQGSISAKHMVICEYDAIMPVVNVIVG